ncbi:MAG: ribonuclease PH [Fimbriimonadaceae bacterium]|nr:ribonuclease PH [Fimbriimonadaceae bacterium]MCZ7581094.1 ribonuclease PH [Fimbriimonadaceae bacterium]QOJ12275.1 MAG: ribonuclease PH [Chthonomonadaceae bacterium]
MRNDSRKPGDLRPTSLQRGFAKFAEGSCLIKQGDTHVLVTATVEDRVPPFLKNSGKGWVTAEYSMLPRSGRQRNQRDTGRPNGRSLEIQRLIGRSLRSVVNLDGLGERTITLDCDAIQADGGTRCASITAAYVALHDAISWMKRERMVRSELLTTPLAAVSVGIYRNQELLDLNYEEDKDAATDMNVVMTGTGKFVEIQGTAEQEPFSVETMGRMLSLAKSGIDKLIELQQAALESSQGFVEWRP